MRKASGLLLSGILAALSVLHIYWAFGGRRGLAYALPTQDGRRLLDPPQAITLVVAGGLFGAMAATLGRIGLWGSALPSSLFRWSVRGLSVLFLLRAVGDFRTVGFWKTITDTPFARWDTRLFSPLCLAMAALAALADAAPEGDSSGEIKKQHG